MNPLAKTVVTGALLTLVTLVGCASRVPVSNENVNLALEQSHTLVKAGEAVTFTAHASGTAGRKEKIEWRADGGKLEKPNQMDRYAQVHYKNPGTYTVTASLFVDGTLVDKEQAVVRVDPLT